MSNIKKPATRSSARSRNSGDSETENNNESNNNNNEENDMVLSSLSECYKYFNNGCQFNPDLDTSTGFKLTEQRIFETSMAMNIYYYKTNNKELASKVPKMYTKEYESLNNSMDEDDEDEEDDEYNNNTTAMDLQQPVQISSNKKRSRPEEFDTVPTPTHPTSTTTTTTTTTTADKKIIVPKSPVKRTIAIVPITSTPIPPPNLQPIKTSNLKKPSASKSNTSILDNITNTKISSPSFPINDNIMKLTQSIIQQNQPTTTTTTTTSPQLSSTLSNLQKQQQLHKSPYLPINLEVEKQIDQLNSRKLKTISSLPRFYKKIDLLDISTMIHLVTDPVLTHKETVSQLGKCLFFAQIPTNIDIPVSRPYFDCDNGTAYWNKKTMPLLKDDPFIKDIVEKNNIDIVMSSSSLIKFMNNHSQNNFCEEWEVPILYKEFNYKQNGEGETTTTKKIIPIIDKPLLKTRITNREKNEKFFNVAIESYGLTAGQLHQTHPPIDYATKNKKEIDKQSPDQTSTTSTIGLLDGKLNKSNLTYNIWEFGSIKILIRCKIHGQVQDNKYKYRYVGLKTRVEYKLDKGYEEPNLSDITKWWTYTLIRPDAHLIISRVNVNGRTLPLTEKLDVASILKHQQHTLNPKKCSKIAWELLKRVALLAGNGVGNYIFSHCPYNNKYNFVDILKEIREDDQDDDNGNPYKTEAVYDLHSIHSNLPVIQNDSIPIVFKQIINNNINNNNNLSQSINQSFCYSFADSGICQKENCNFKHLTKDEIKLIGGGNNNKKGNNNNNKSKNKKKKKSNNNNNNNNLPTNNNKNNNNNSVNDLSYITSIL